MPGMPSARGLEWRTDGKSRKRYDQGFDRIPMDPKTGKMVYALPTTTEPILQKLPESCHVCTLLENCEASCAHGSQQCRARLGI